MKSISKRLNVIFVGMVTLVLIGSGALNYYSAKVDLDQRGDGIKYAPQAQCSRTAVEF